MGKVFLSQQRWQERFCAIHGNKDGVMERREQLGDPGPAPRLQAALRPAPALFIYVVAEAQYK